MAKITLEFYDKENKPISEEDIFYSLKEIRQIGSGGFGVVYLVQDEGGNFYALKRVYKENETSYKKELKSIKLYRKISKNCKCKSIIQILAFREIEEGIEYLMPLADGVGKFSPTSERWKPKTLATLIQNRYKKGGVFTTQDVLDIFSPLFEAIKFLNESGVLHRDIKPENILFFNGTTCLADIGLLREDTLTMSAAGTPLYAPPTWFLDTHGNPDVWGLASVLYYFLSGNPPDTISRINYMYPPSKRKMSKADIKAWEHFHRVILRAMRGKSNERFLTIDDFFDAFKNIDEKVDKAPKTSFLKRKRKPSVATLAIPTKQETSIFSLSGRINRTTFFFAYALLGIFSVCVPYLENL